MDINNMTRKQFEALPHKDWSEDIGLIDYIIILPTRRKHDSGYRCMDFVAVQNDKATYRLSGCSDVINIGGIAAYMYSASGWLIDCLPKSGLLRIWCSESKIKSPLALSNFELIPANRGEMILLKDLEKIKRK